MNKNLIALAVAAAMAAPLAAQAEVTVSGGLQAEVVNLGGGAADTTITGNNAAGLYAMDAAENAKQNSGNYGFLKFSSSEDLGGGMTAIATYNMNIAVDNVLATRDAYIGLSGGFGTILAGRLSTPYKSSTVSWDPFLATAAQARGSNGMSGLHNSYVNNAVAYANKFGSAKVVAAVVLDEATDGVDTTETNGKHAVSFSVNAPVGPVELALAFIDVSEHADPVNGGAYGKNMSATKVGVKWTSGAITVAGQYEMLDKGFNTVANNEGINVMFVTASYAMGANTVSASYGADDKKDAEGSYMAVGVKHTFSKNTSVFAAYRANDRDVTGADMDVNALTVGMRVGF
jgi:predicted porin